MAACNINVYCHIGTREATKAVAAAAIVWGRSSLEHKYSNKLQVIRAGAVTEPSEQEQQMPLSAAGVFYCGNEGVE